MQYAHAQVFTIGHSTRSIKDFIALLHQNGIEAVVDVRTFPRSRTNPQFDEKSLAKSLKRANIMYGHAPELGGLRKASKNSINNGWQKASFRGFADYMQTTAFRKAINLLIHVAHKKRVALMCAESVPWRCHRSLIADALVVRGVDVIHTISPTSFFEHHLTSFVSRRGIALTYPGPQTAHLSNSGSKLAQISTLI